MTLLDLYHRRESDEEFLARPEVWRLYWQALGSIEGKYFAAPPIPPLLKAVEELRKACIERDKQTKGDRFWNRLCLHIDGAEFDRQILMKPIERFVVFLAALTEGQA